MKYICKIIADVYHIILMITTIYQINIDEQEKKSY